MRSRKAIAHLLLLLLFAAGCDKPEPENPYAAIPRPSSAYNPTADDLPVGSFAWLHGKVFLPTCANSGCHDGTFEPEFRTVAGAYNSLVNHPVIANDPQNSFTYRVKPGNVGASFLHTRMTTFVPNTSGIMPLNLEPDSDFPEKRWMYIAKIEEWIQAGAPDMFGTPAPPADVNAPPSVFGIALFPAGNTTAPYTRQLNSPYGIGSFLVPPGLVDVWIMALDDNAGVSNFSGITLKAATGLTSFDQVSAVPFSLNPPITALLIDNSPAQFFYKATLDLSAYPSGQILFLRTYVDDGVQPSPVEIPAEAAQFFWHLLFSIKTT